MSLNSLKFNWRQLNFNWTFNELASIDIQLSANLTGANTFNKLYALAPIHSIVQLTCANWHSVDYQLVGANWIGIQFIKHSIYSIYHLIWVTKKNMQLAVGANPKHRAMSLNGRQSIECFFIDWIQSIVPWLFHP